MPMLLVIQPDGTVDSYSSITSLPATQEQAVIRAAIWKYVRDRESYNFADSPGRYQLRLGDVVTDGSRPYQHWFLQEFNQMTPQAALARRDRSTSRLKSDDLSLSEHVVFVRFQRSLQFYEQPHARSRPGPPRPNSSSATRHATASRDEGDPGGIVVVRYTTAKDTPTP